MAKKSDYTSRKLGKSKKILDFSELCYENSRGMKSQRFAAVWWRFTKVFDSFGVLF